MKTKIQRFAKFFRAIFFIALIVSPLLTGIVWLSGGEVLVLGEDNPAMAIKELTADLPIDQALIPDYPLPMSTRLMGLGVDMIPTGIRMLSWWWLFLLFGCFTAGEIFTRNTVKYIRRTGWTVLIGAGFMPIHEALMTVALTIQNPPGERMVAFSIDSANLEEIVIGGIIILVSWIMDEGRELRETEELTV